jgi:hypothetical protein
MVRTLEVSMNKTSLIAITGVALIQACSAYDGLCQKELKLNLDDDFVDICAAQASGSEAVLRKSAEPECGKLADARLALVACQSVLGCEDFANSVQEAGSDDDKCKDFSKGLTEAVEATDFGLACDGIEDDEGSN